MPPTRTPGIQATCHIVAIPADDGFNVVGPFATQDAAERWVTTKLVPGLSPPQLAGVRFTALYAPEQIEQHAMGASG